VKREVHATIDNNETVLTFQSHGITNATAMVGGTNAMNHLGVPLQHAGAMPGSPVPMPGYNNQAVHPIGNTTGASPNNYRQIPSRRIRGADTPMTTSPYAGAAPTPLGSPNQPGPPPMDAAEQYLRMHLDKAAQEKATGTEFPPLPIVE